VLRKIFGPKKDEINEQFMILHNEKLCNLFRAPSIVKIVKSRRLAKMGETRNAYKILMGKLL
jgi:hypothetical protein